MDSPAALLLPVAFLLCSTASASPAPAYGDFLGSTREEVGWTWAPTEGLRDIRVAPMVVLGQLPVMEQEGFLGERLDLAELRIRSVRNDEIARLPEVLGRFLPGELARSLDQAWDAHLRTAHFQAGARGRLRAGVEEGRGLDAVLATMARQFPGEAVLFQWVSDVQATPLCLMDVPGSALRVAERLVFVDRLSDPVWIQATLGIALVSTDGEVILRYEDSYDGILSRTTSLDRTGREMARALADDLAPLLSDGLSMNMALDER